MCFPVTLWEEKLRCLSNRVWLGCSDAVSVLGEPDQEEAAVTLPGGLTFPITEPNRERKVWEEVAFLPRFVFVLCSLRKHKRFCI